MWVEPLKSELTTPGTKRSKLKCDILLSRFASNLTLRRYTNVLSCLALVCLVRVFLNIPSKPQMAPGAFDIVKAFTVAAVPGCLAVADSAAASSDLDNPARFLALVGVGPSHP